MSFSPPCSILPCPDLLCPDSEVLISFPLSSLPDPVLGTVGFWSPSAVSPAAVRKCGPGNEEDRLLCRETEKKCEWLFFCWALQCLWIPPKTSTLQPAPLQSPQSLYILSSPLHSTSTSTIHPVHLLSTHYLTITSSPLHSTSTSTFQPTHLNSIRCVYILPASLDFKKASTFHSALLHSIQKTIFSATLSAHKKLANKQK